MSADFPTIGPSPHEEGQPGLHMQLEGFEISDEVEAVARKLIDRHGRLYFLDQFRIGYLLHHTDPPKSKDRHKWATARLAPKWALPFMKVDGCITVNQPVWQVLSEERREALMLHELLHYGQNEDSGALETVPHDIEEFGFVVAEYGQWRNSLVYFAEQLALGLAKQGQVPSGD